MPLTGYDNEDAFYRIDAQLDREERDAARDRSDATGAYIHCRTCDQFAWTPDASAPYEGAECARCQEKGR